MHDRCEVKRRFCPSENPKIGRLREVVDEFFVCLNSDDYSLYGVIVEDDETDIASKFGVSGLKHRCWKNVRTQSRACI